MITGRQRDDLLSCPCCGTHLHLFEIRYPNGDNGWLLATGLDGCMVCSSIGAIESEDVERFVSDWNTRKAVEDEG